MAQAGEKMWYGWPELPDHNPESTMTTSKRNNFAVDLADLERTLVSVNHAPTAHVKRWNPPATHHNRSATTTTMTKPNITVASNITPTPTITHCVTKSTLIADAPAVITQRENTPETENGSVTMVREHYRRLKKNYCASLVHSQMH